MVHKLNNHTANGYQSGRHTIGEAMNHLETHLNWLKYMVGQSLELHLVTAVQQEMNQTTNPIQTELIKCINNINLIWLHCIPFTII